MACVEGDDAARGVWSEGCVDWARNIASGIAMPPRTTQATTAPASVTRLRLRASSRIAISRPSRVFGRAMAIAAAARMGSERPAVAMAIRCSA